MSFDYDKVKAQSEDSHGNSWTAYSDLFMMLSTVFLLLYVSVSLRSQTSGIEVQRKAKQLADRNADLEQQIQVYNTLRDDHMKKETSEQEQEVYQKLMGKLDLLQEEAKDEKNKLRAKAKENEEKEYALNEYQKLIRNIINTNILSKTQLQKRDLIIEKKDTITKEQKVVIADQEDQINNLNKDIEMKKDELAKNEDRINQINKDLKKKIDAIKRQRKEAEISNAQMNKRILALKENSKKMLSELEKKNKNVQEELESAQNNLSATQQEIQRKEQELANAHQSLAGTKQKLNELGKQVKEVENEKGRALSAVANLQKENAGLATDLKHAQEIAKAKSDLTKKIKSELNKAGLSGDVDAKSGDVTLAFGEEYFDAGSAKLKPSMMETLKKFMPGYSKSLFSDEKIANKIENVEIIGFASSTYNGKYVPPDSLKQEDREAINYNLKLSFNRADAIFKHIFDTKKMSFEHQHDLLPKIKVVGRGYLPEGKSGKDFPPAMSQKEFCSKYNCNAAQKVIIKFKLKD